MAVCHSRAPGTRKAANACPASRNPKPSPIARANPTNRGPVKPSGGSTSWFILESLVVPSRGRLNPVSGLPECPTSLEKAYSVAEGGPVSLRAVTAPMFGTNSAMRARNRTSC